MGVYQHHMSLRGASCMLVQLLLLLAQPAPAAAGRVLLQEPAAYASSRGQQPTGRYALMSDSAGSGVSSFTKGVRYNGGRIQTAGDGVPGPLAAGSTSDVLPHARTRSGNTAADGNINLGREVIAATSEGARAAAGSGVGYMADGSEPAQLALTGSEDMFRPRVTRARGSSAFTDVAGTSAAVAGQGNGPAALASAMEVAAFSRSHRNAQPVRAPRDGHDGGT